MIRAFYILTAIPELADNTCYIYEWLTVELAVCVVVLVFLVIVHFITT
jgi:hypothetical protein